MYEKPTLEVYGTLRDLTRVGFTGCDDGAFICSTPNPTDVSPGADRS